MPPRPLYYAAYLALSVIGMWGVAANPASATHSKIADHIFASPSPIIPGTPPIALRKRFTGLNTVDSVLATLGSAFLPATIPVDRETQLQQVNFLIAWSGVLVVWSLEAARTRNKGKIISFTSAWSILYQCLSASFIAPLYCLIFTYTTASSQYTRQTTAIPHDRARALLPALMLGYIAPTLSLYYPPNKSIDALQIVIRFWLFSPLLVNVLWALIRPSGKPVSLRSIYLTAASITAMSHLRTLYLCGCGYVDWTKVWIPMINKDTPYNEALKFVFQWDYTIIFITTTLWAVYEVQRIKEQVDPTVNVGRVIMGMLAGSVVFGPAAVLCAVWAWREGKLQAKRAELRRSAGRSGKEYLQRQSM